MLNLEDVNVLIKPFAYIIIDPPYNTGVNDFIYNDNFYFLALIFRHAVHANTFLLLSTETLKESHTTKLQTFQL